MKSLSTALIAMGLSTFVFTTLPAIATPVVNAPQLRGGLVLGVTGYYLKSSHNHNSLDYFEIDGDDSCQRGRLEPGYNWGWGINAGYVSCNNCYDINFDYFHYRARDKDCFTDEGVDGFEPVANTFNFPLTDPSVLNPVYDNDVCASTRLEINQIDLSLGRYFNLGCRFRVHPFVGVNWLRLHRDLDTHFEQVSTVITPSAILQIQDTNFEERSKFQGIGPWAGIDAVYCLGCGFGIVGHIDGALFFGSTNVRVNEDILQSAEVPDVVFDSVSDAHCFDGDNNHHTVPFLDAKLGLNYTWILNNCCANSAMAIEVGWMFSRYYRAVDRWDTNTTIQNARIGGTIESIITVAEVRDCHTSDITLNGPYVSLVFRI